MEIGFPQAGVGCVLFLGGAAVLLPLEDGPGYSTVGACGVGHPGSASDVTELCEHFS